MAGAPCDDAAFLVAGYAHLRPLFGQSGCSASGGWRPGTTHVRALARPVREMTANELFTPECAALLIDKGRRIAASLQLAVFRPRVGPPGGVVPHAEPGAIG